MLKLYLNMSTDQKKKQKMILKKILFKLMNNSVLGKTVENNRKQWDIKLGTTERRRNYFISESNYHTINYSTEQLLAIEMKKNADTYG